MQWSHLLTDKAQGNLASLLEKAPQTATILQATAEGQPDFSQTDTVRAVDVHVGSLMLVRPGEQVGSDSDSCLCHSMLAMMSSQPYQLRQSWAIEGVYAMTSGPAQWQYS